MKIAIFGYAHPFGYGSFYGAEREIFYLIQQLIQKGHEPVVFSVKGCVLPCPYVIIPKPWDDQIDLHYEAMKKYESEKGIKFDMIHSYMASGFISKEMRDNYSYCLEPFFGFTRFTENVITYSHKLNDVNGNRGSVIHYGLPEKIYQEELSDPDDYLVWIGRIDMGKAPDIAIEVAQRLDKRIILMGPAYHYPYFMDRIYGQIDGDKVIWLRTVNDTIKRRVFKKASCFLSTNWCQYHEMLGIVNIEALACGCPVIGWGNAKQPSAINFKGGEIIDHGKHGFINEYNDYSEDEREKSIQKAVEFVKQIGSIDRKECYQRFKERFTSEIMTEKHLKYYSIVKERKTVYNITNEL